MTEFFQTRMGRQFFEATLPRAADALGRIAEELAALNATLRTRGATEPADADAQRRRLADIIAAFRADDAERLEATVAQAEAELERDKLSRT